MTRIGPALLATFWSGRALADKQLSGVDDAYIDWVANNCGVKITDKEHTMVDQANAKYAATFLRKYQKQEFERCTVFACEAVVDVRRYQGLVWSLWQPVR